MANSNCLQARKILFFTFSLIIFIISASQVGVFASNSSDSVFLKEGYFRWDNPDLNEIGISDYTSDDSLNVWSKTSDLRETGDAPDDKNALLLKIELPKLTWSTPAVYLESIYAQTLSVYVESRQVYKRDINWLPNVNKLIIPLSIEDSGKNLYIIVQKSVDGSIGLQKDIVLGEYQVLVRNYFRQNFIDIFLGLTTILFSIVILAVSMFLGRNKIKQWGSLSLIIFFIGIELTVYPNNLGAYFPTFEMYTAIASDISLFGFCFTLTYFFDQIFGPGYKNLIHLMWRFQGVLFIVFSVFEVFNAFKGFQHTTMYNYMINLEGIVFFIQFTVLIWAALYLAIKRNIDAKIFSAGFLLFAILSSIDTAIYLIVSREYSFLLWKWGVFAFAVSLVCILGRRVAANYVQVVAYSKELEIKNEELDSMWREVKRSRDVIAKWNSVLEEEVARRTTSIKSLLDNAGQGFLSFGKTLVVGDEYSQECTRIFGCEIRNKRYAEFVYSGNPDKVNFVENVLKMAFNEKDPMRRNSYLNLLSEEVKIKSREVYIDYKLIGDSETEDVKTIMAILTDITEKRELETRIEEENILLKRLIIAVKCRRELLDSIEDYRDFCNRQIPELLDSSEKLEKIVSNLLRRIHTFKGTFGQWHMLELVQRLHELEEEIIRFKDTPNVNLPDLKRCLDDMGISEWLEGSLKVLKENFGEEFLQKENIVEVDKSRLDQIEKKISSILVSEESINIVKELNSLAYKPFKDLFKAYPEYVRQTTENLGKSIGTFKIKGGGFLVDCNKYRKFTNSLVHIFKNIASHGVESIDERIQKNKVPSGKVECNIKLLDNRIYIRIKDDGKGLDLERLRLMSNRADTEFGQNEDIKTISESEIIKLIFAEGLSLTENATEISGRGIGLSSVKNEVDVLGGRIMVRSSEGKGTSFLIMLPFLD